MEVFGDSLALRRIMAAPAGQRAHVEILPIDMHPLTGDLTIDVIDEPLPSCGIAQVEQVPEQPLWVMLGEPTAADTFWFEPDQALRAQTLRALEWLRRTSLSAGS